LPVMRTPDDFLDTEAPPEAEREPEAEQAREAAASSKTPSQITEQSGSKREEIPQACAPAWWLDPRLHGLGEGPLMGPKEHHAAPEMASQGPPDWLLNSTPPSRVSEQERQRNGPPRVPLPRNHDPSWRHGSDQARNNAGEAAISQGPGINACWWLDPRLRNWGGLPGSYMFPGAVS
jgi:hypothetical protein